MASIAFLSPMPPASTGIATYSAAVLDGMRQAGLLERHDIRPMWPLTSDAEERVAAADVAVYQLGNNVEFHGEIYRLSVWYPGVAVLHDLALDGLMYGLGVARSPLAEPARSEAIAAAPPGENLDYPLGVPWCAQAVRRARAVIVHSRFAASYLERIGCKTPITIAPHPLVEADDEIDRARARGAAFRARVAGDGAVIVGIAGDLNASKGIAELLDAVGRVTSDLRVLLVGRSSPHWDLRSVLRHSGVADRVTVVPDASDEDFLAWLSAFDVLVNLRNPHRGETSGSLVRALHVGVPTVVSAVGTYLEVPDDVVARIPPALPIRRRSRMRSSDWRATPASARRWGSGHARTRESRSRRAPPPPRTPRRSTACSRSGPIQPGPRSPAGPPRSRRRAFAPGMSGVARACGTRRRSPRSPDPADAPSAATLS